MSYLVLARKWRPQTFSDLIGQEHVSRTLQNAIDTGRVAHAFLFTGARGVGKTSSARILAKALNCEQGLTTEPCNTCPSCTEITDGNSVDVFEIDGASNTGVDDIRELRDNVKYLPSRSRYKIFIIDEVHMLTNNAFNALLKTLEEPPAHVKFIFATTEPHKVPITILSRCQRFDFKRIALQKIVDRLRYIVDQEQVSVSDKALAVVARKGDGSMRDSLSTLDQVLAFCGQTVTDEDVAGLLGVVDRRLLLEASQSIFARDSRAALEIVKRVDSFGYNMRQFCQELIDHFRNITILRTVVDAADILDLSEGEIAELKTQASATPPADLQRHLSILLKAEGEMAHSTFPRLVLEMALLKMASLSPLIPINELLDRLKALEGRTSASTVASPTPTWEKSAPRPESTAHQTDKSTVSPPAQNESRQPSPPQQAAAAGDTHRDNAPPPATGDAWSGFVAFVRGKKPFLASFLEYGRPLAVSAELLEIGYPAGSFQLSKMQDPDSLAELKGLAQQFFRREPGIRFKSLTEGGGDVPQSLLEKKSLEETNRKQQLRQKAMEHPLVNAALEVFGGVMGEVVKIDDKR
ncbi:DNA polymerase III subunit gamma/tau [Geotalea uraniireducens]|uniref:DNA polymerase III subunit gamma/tau n=1 Tax=Geotalea uraniireducens (strain Rf4) TaxID=351605 RepID=A5G9K2_GEOUR|nr:DNA polymerase III subunit gamma/tau [Geotalea uraniireducens]ABQ28470.1 DNA polymerase III, tau subunit [Geotalea uraniireducens Rf4]